MNQRLEKSNKSMDYRWFSHSASQCINKSTKFWSFGSNHYTMQSNESVNQRINEQQGPNGSKILWANESRRKWINESMVQRFSESMNESVNYLMTRNEVKSREMKWNQIKHNEIERNEWSEWNNEIFRSQQDFTIFVWHRALASVSRTFCRLHFPKHLFNLIIVPFIR